MMPNTLIVNHDLEKARRDLDEAMHALGATWTVADRDATSRLIAAGEAMMRANASAVAALERLAALRPHTPEGEQTS